MIQKRILYIILFQLGVFSAQGGWLGKELCNEVEQANRSDYQLVVNVLARISKKYEKDFACINKDNKDEMRDCLSSTIQQKKAKKISMTHQRYFKQIQEDFEQSLLARGALETIDSREEYAKNRTVWGTFFLDTIDEREKIDQNLKAKEIYEKMASLREAYGQLFPDEIRDTSIFANDSDLRKREKCRYFKAIRDQYTPAILNLIEEDGLPIKRSKESIELNTSGIKTREMAEFCLACIYGNNDPVFYQPCRKILGSRFRFLDKKGRIHRSLCDAFSPEVCKECSDEFDKENSWYLKEKHPYSNWEL